ncbi:MAG: topoisomerase DNA-binding C4 zinc finger domain-containing protein [Candidatus Thorarchaeota archaeon]
MKSNENVLKTPTKCPKCGKPLEIRHGEYGTYLDCTGYPKCKFTQEISKKEKIKTEVTPTKCPECGKKLSMYIGKFGMFLGCNGYPKCRYSFNFKNPAKIPCPECGKTMIERTGMYGIFYGCTGFPECKFTFPVRIKKKKLEKPKKLLEIPEETSFITDNILNALSDKWQSFQDLANRLYLTDKMDVRYLELKLKELTRKKIINSKTIENVKKWKLN